MNGERNSLIIPSLVVIATVGAVKIQLVPAARWSVMAFTSMNGSLKASGGYLDSNRPKLNAQQAALWGGAIALLAGVGLTLGKGNLGDVLGALMSLTAVTMVVKNWNDIAKSFHLPTTAGAIASQSQGFA